MANTDGIVGELGMTNDGFIAAAKEAIAALDKTGKAATNLNVTINNVTKTTQANASAVVEQTAALKRQTAEAKLAEAAAKAQAAAARAHTAEIKQQAAALRLQAMETAAVNRVERQTRRGGGGAPTDKTGIKIGQMGQQVQDVAVSLQGGMGLLQVAGQQLPQILGIFSNIGAVMGGVAAVTAAVSYGIIQTRKGFENFTQTARETNMELSRTIQFGNSFEVFSGLSKASKQLENINAEADKFNGVGGFFRGLAANIDGKFGGSSELEQRVEFAARQIEMEKLREKLEIRSLELSNESLRVQTLRAQGKNDEADAEERRLATLSKIYDVFKQDGMSIGGKASLALNVMKGSEVEEAYIAEAKAAKIMSEAQAKADKDDAERNEQIAKKQEDFNDQQKKDFEEFEKAREKSNKSVAEMLDWITKEENKIAERRRKAEEKRGDAAEKAAEKEEKGRLEAVEQADKARVLEAEITSGDKIAKQLERQLKFATDIAKAKEDHNAALVEGLEKERDLLKVQEAIDEQLKSPEQKKKERDEEKERKKAARIVASRARRMAQAAGGAGFGGFVDEKGRAVGVPNIQPNAPAAGAAGAAGGNQMKVDTLVVKVLKHG